MLTVIESRYLRDHLSREKHQDETYFEGFGSKNLRLPLGLSPIKCGLVVAGVTAVIVSAAVGEVLAVPYPTKPVLVRAGMITEALLY